MMSKKYTGTEAPVFDQRLEDLDIDEDTIDITDVEDDAEAHRHAEARRYVDMFVDPTVIERRRAWMDHDYPEPIITWRRVGKALLFAFGALIWAIAIVAFVISASKIVQACEGDQGHAYISAAVGRAGTLFAQNPDEQDKWEDDKGAHAMFTLGYRHPLVSNWLWVGAEVGHHSTFTKTPPEPELDYAVIKLEARLIP